RPPRAIEGAADAACRRLHAVSGSREERRLAASDGAKGSRGALAAEARQSPRAPARRSRQLAALDRERLIARRFTYLTERQGRLPRRATSAARQPITQQRAHHSRATSERLCRQQVSSGGMQ